MSCKKESPARPPPPKGLGKKVDSNPSIKFSYKSLELEEEDEEDLTIFTGELTKKVESDKLKLENKSIESSNRKSLEKKKDENTEPKLDENILRKDSGETKKFIPTQRSLDSPRHTSTSSKVEQPPSRSSSDNKLQKYSTKSGEEDGSAISWFKQNVAEISSVVKDKAEKARKRIGEFSENIGKEEDNKVKELKVNAPESGKSSQFVSSESGKPSNENKESLQHEVRHEIVQQLKATPVEKIKEVQVDTVTCLENTKVPDTGNEEEDPDEFEIVDDFFTNEPAEDFTGIPSIEKTDAFVKQKSNKTSLKRRFVKGKAPKFISPVAMSKLSKDNIDEVEDSTNAFYDAKDETLKIVSLSKPPTETSKMQIFTESIEKHVHSKKLVVIVGFIFLYLIIPLPSYISGMIMGSFFASLGWISYIFITKPPTVKDPPKRIPLKDLPPMIEPEIKDVSLDEGVTVHKGWMNEIPEYNQDNYHISKTHSVHVYLDGTTLRLRHPKNNISKRAMWDEESPKTNEFVHQRYFNLEGSQVFLLPPGLVKKRVWSKKYPICIALKNLGSKQTRDVNESLPESDQGFEIIAEEKCDASVLYLFARTCREKEEWYKKIEAACKGEPLKHHLVEVKKFFVNRKPTSIITSASETQPKRQTPSEGTPQHSRHGSTDSISSNSSSSSPVNETPENVSSAFNIEEFVRYIGRTMPKEYYSSFMSPYKRNPIENKDTIYMIDCEPQLLFLNAVISRCSWDFLHQKYWADKIMDKLQKKLDKIHIPYFIEAFKITDINLGAEMPVIRRAGKPYLDNQGFWVDLDVNYGGGFKMTIETKVNLMRLKKVSKDSKENKESRKKSAVLDSEEEDSAESSTDEDEELVTPGSEESGTATGGKRRFMKYLKKITDSKYFQSATEMKYVKKAMEEVSNTPLVLTVELRFLSGTLAVNIPPPPTDRLWYGFRGNPKLTLVAKPKVGERRVTVSHITDFIEKKLSVEFQRVLVMPNLDDIVIPLMLPEYMSETVPVPKFTSSSQPQPSSSV